MSDYMTKVSQLQALRKVALAEDLLEAEDGWNEINPKLVEILEIMGYTTLGAGVDRIAVRHESMPEYVFKIARHHAGVEANCMESEIYQCAVARNVAQYFAAVVHFSPTVLVQEFAKGEDSDDTEDYFFHFVESKLCAVGLYSCDIHTGNVRMDGNEFKVIDYGTFYFVPAYE